ncbi:MAG: hypothetical protein WA006_00515 [Rhodoglobus sp.]
MHYPTAETATPAAWLVPVARAVPALALAGVITFTPDHSAPLGFVTFGIFGVLAGLVALVGALRAAHGVERGLGVSQAVITLTAGVVAFLVPQGGLPFLIFLVTAFAASTGAIELYLGVRARGYGHGARDRVFVGALTALLAIGLLLVPPGLAQPLGGIEAVSGVLTASVVVVGALGAYWAVLGVYLVIAGLSIKWAPSSATGTADSGA